MNAATSILVLTSVGGIDYQAIFNIWGEQLDGEQVFFFQGTFYNINFQ